MIVVTSNAVVALEGLGELFTVFTGRAVYNTTFIFKTCFKHYCNVFIDHFDVLFVSNFIE